MKVVVLNGSPAGENSITLYTVKYLEKCFPRCKFEVLHVGQRIKQMERDFAPCAKALTDADLLLFCYPVYTFLVPAQLHRFVELMKEQNLPIAGKYATQVSTSKHFYDMTAHRFVQENCADLGLRTLPGLSADMDDLLSEKGQREAFQFFAHVLWQMAQGFCDNVSRTGGSSCAEPFALQPTCSPLPHRDGKVVIVTDSSADAGSSREKMIERFRAALPMETAVVDLKEFPFKGGCIGCFHCAADGKCFYKDGFDAYLREQIQSADAIVYAFSIKDHSMGYRFKLYDDRQFCNGHRTVTMGKPVGYLVAGDLAGEENLRLLIESRAQVGGNYLAGVANDRGDPGAQIDRLAAELLYALQNDFRQPQNFYGVGGLKIFRDLIFQMRGLMKADHRFYRDHGFYDFPQKRRMRIAAMYAVGAMMNNETLRKKAGGKMTEGMVLPYRKALENAVVPAQPDADAAAQTVETA